MAGRRSAGTRTAASAAGTVGGEGDHGELGPALLVGRAGRCARAPAPRPPRPRPRRAADAAGERHGGREQAEAERRRDPPAGVAGVLERAGQREPDHGADRPGKAQDGSPGPARATGGRTRGRRRRRRRGPRWPSRSRAGSAQRRRASPPSTPAPPASAREQPRDAGEPGPQPLRRRQVGRGQRQAGGHTRGPGQQVPAEEQERERLGDQQRGERPDRRRPGEPAEQQRDEDDDRAGDRPPVPQRHVLHGEEAERPRRTEVDRQQAGARGGQRLLGRPQPAPGRPGRARRRPAR